MSDVNFIDLSDGMPKCIVGTHKVVVKPWGKEVWMELNDRYCYKRIYINAGHRTSLQYHNFKHETNYIISGEAKVLIGTTWYDLRADDYFTITPGVHHRVVAVTDVVLQETSTPEVDDVIRIEDDAQRPDGRIEAEHA
jgi:mannose-6-phosphate isomerase